MNYFVRNGDSFYSIYDNQKMSVTYTASLQDILENQLNSARGGINPDYSFNTEFGNGVSPANRYYIPYRWYVSTIEHPDNFDGKCGFVAASLILNWWDRTKKEFIPSEYREDNGNLVRKTHAEDEKYSLADHLVDLNGGVKEPWALTVRDTLVKFGNEVGIKAEAGYFLGGINLGNEIKDGRPTILFGALPDIRTEHHSKIAHAVAVYGTEKHEWLSYFIVNYGWNDEFYNEVVLNSGFFGSTTTFRLVG